MNAHAFALTKFGLKLFAGAAGFPESHAFLTVFHDWIKKRALAEQMIDVVDYAHVHNGPAVHFNGHESDYNIDFEDGKAGLLYRRKRAPDVAGASALEDGLRRLFRAADLLLLEPTLKGLTFDVSSVRVVSFDRLALPNTDEAFFGIAENADRVAKKLWGDSAKVSRVRNDAREPLTFTISGANASLDELKLRLS